MRVCMFCGERAASLEDAWPLWLMKRFQGQVGTSIEAERGGQALGTWQTVNPGIKVKHVCASCNNGWMSRLESQAESVVEPLLEEAPQAFDLRARSVLAGWAVKTAMVLEAVREGQRRFYSDDERRQMRVDQTPPERTSVWLAKVVEHSGAYSAASELRGSALGSDDPIRAFVTTLAFGSLAIQVVSTRLPAAIPPAMKLTTQARAGPWDLATARLWPTDLDVVAWPPSVGLAGESGLEALRLRFSPEDPEAEPS